MFEDDLLQLFDAIFIGSDRLEFFCDLLGVFMFNVIVGSNV